MKKRSDANSIQKPPKDSPVFFIDACLGKQIVLLLSEAGEQVIHHNDHFPDGTRDETWLEEAGKRKWIVLTKDDRIRYHKAAIFAIKNSGATAIILPKGNLKIDEMVKIFLKAMPKIKQFVLENKAPFLLRLTPAGEIMQVDLDSKR